MTVIMVDEKKLGDLLARINAVAGMIEDHIATHTKEGSDGSPVDRLDELDGFTESIDTNTAEEFATIRKEHGAALKEVGKEIAAIKQTSAATLGTSGDALTRSLSAQSHAFAALQLAQRIAKYLGWVEPEQDDESAVSG